MIVIKALFVMFSLPLVDVTVYVYNTVDSPSVEFYDCILHKSLYYCRRPTKPVALNRRNDTRLCYYNGTAHSFADLRRHNVNISIVLHQWRSSIEQAEHYSRYMRDPSKLDGYVCECTDPQSFGKNCEYLLPNGTTFAQTLIAENLLKTANPRDVQLHGDIICYMTLECNSGLLCLDWRDICDGVQQCMSGLDGENCDKLEFNECEKNEYRCMNGMCIPEEYFLDGEFDCLDWSDEIQYYDDANCPIEEASAQCDDRLCPPNQWSCGDGQCIFDRFEFQKLSQTKSECRSRREQYFVCETRLAKPGWTLPTGRCYDGNLYEEVNIHNRTIREKCQYLLKCYLSKAAEKNCPCGASLCAGELNVTCPSDIIQYPRAGIMAPYILFFYHRTRNSFSVRPDFALINGTIKCEGILINIFHAIFLKVSTIQEIEDTLCRQPKDEFALHNHKDLQHCHRHHLTFDNHSYSSSNVCNKSKKCISTYRIKDGFFNCVDKMDELEQISIFSICSTVQRYRFQCSVNESTCLSVTALGNTQNDCENKFDELWLGTGKKISDTHCNNLWTHECETLRQYIENSWALNSISESTEQLQIPFRHYCDTFWSLASKEDENTSECRDWWICPKEQWQCDTGQCINENWVLDGEWDCSDASDEDNIFYRPISDRNLQVIEFFNLMIRYSNFWLNSVPFSTICNLDTEFPCVLVNVSNLLNNLEDNRPCISRDRIGDGHIDCYGAIDERNTIAHCNQSTTLGYNFKCNSSQQCIPYGNHCVKDRCSTKFDDQSWCDRRKDPSRCNRSSDAVCLDGTCVEYSRCNRIRDCSFGEDEYMCEHPNVSESFHMPYRKEKELTVRNASHKLGLIQFPTNSNITKQKKNSISLTETTSTVTISITDISAPIAYCCNRGVGVQMYNDSIACFCPPQYHGDKCQFHTDRITVLLHLDLSQSTYTLDNGNEIVLRIIILFLFNNETIMNHAFHFRSVTELIVYSKKMVHHFLYSRSFRFLQHKTQRYFNQSSIINDHPYAIRIETYERKEPGEPLLIAVWQYPIFFDYLPVFRLAKVLRLTKPNMKQNPCSSNRCNQNQECQQLLNDKSKYICLCKSNFTGENCSIKDQQCADGYCAFESLCKPNYRGLLVGNELPYCICSFKQLGERCNVEHDKCLSNPCQNNGTCFPTSAPDTIACLCTEQYHGKNCELRKLEIQLYINESVNHVAAVVQYFEIDFISLNIMLVHQKVYRHLPMLIEYRHKQKTVPEIILIKLYSSQIKDPIQLYLISLHINVTSIYATIPLIEKNRCADVRILTSDNTTEFISNYSRIKYHYLCRNNTNLFCFRDEFYLCVFSDNHSRVECFRYDYKLDRCFHCLADGLCLQEDRTQPNKFICVCPPCHSGTKCQFNSNSFAFTLDQLFFTDLISIHQKTTIQLLIILPLLLFLLALPNNLFSFITFCRQNCLCNGIGQYLLYMSVINQLNLGILAARLIHLAINIASLYSHSLLDNYLCKILSYLLTSSSRMVYWLSSLVAIERFYMTLFLNGRWLKKPHIARRLIFLTCIGILISDIHELVFIKSLFGVHDGRGSICIIEFPINYRSKWLLFHLILSIINSILPLLINICSTIIISCVMTKKKMNMHMTNYKTKAERNNAQNKTSTNESILNNFRVKLRLVSNVISENKEFVIGPGITVIPQLFLLPLFIISFTLYCQNLEHGWVRYLLIVSYFASFIPQLISFMLYILPSSFYSTEWHSTKIGQWTSGFFRYSRPVPTITIISSTTN